MGRITDQRVIRDLTVRLARLETKVDGALNAAYVNYDPLVNQLSELRREFMKMRMEQTPAPPPSPHRETYTLRTEWRNSPVSGLYVTVSNPKYGELSAVMACDGPWKRPGVQATRTQIKKFADALFEQLLPPSS